MSESAPGSDLLIRRSVADDAPALTRLMSDPSVFAGLLQMPYPSEVQWRERLTADAGGGGHSLSLVALRAQELVGSAGLMPVGAQARRRHAMSLGLSVAASARRQGVGTALLGALCDYADRWLGVLRLELTVYVDNDVAVRLYRRFGFEIEGTMRGYALRDGHHVDAHAMARWHPHPPAAPARITSD